MRPTVGITRDPYFGHRHPVTGKPMGDRNEWISWDFALMDAYSFIEDYTGPEGIPVWLTESDDVDVIAEKRINRFESAKERTTSRKNYKKSPGEYYVARVETLPERETPTFASWRAARMEKALEAAQETLETE